MKRIALWLTAAAAVLGLAVAGSGIANATVSPSYLGTSDGEAGYLANQLGTEYTSTIGSLDINPGLQAIGVTASLADPSGAVGGGLCNNSDSGGAAGVAAEVGLVQASPGSFSVVYAYGRMKNNDNDPCVNNGILTDGLVLHTALTGLTSSNDPMGITYDVEHFRREVCFAVEDNTSGRSFGACISTLVRTKVGRHRHIEADHYYPFNEPLAGVMADPSELGGGSPSTDLVDFSGVTVNGHLLGTGSGSLGQFAFPVASSGDGAAPWLIGPATSCVALHRSF